MEADVDSRHIEEEKYLSLMSTLKGQEEFLLNREGVIVSTNLEAVNVTGYEEWEVLGKHFAMFYSEGERAHAAADLNKAVALGQAMVSGLFIKKRGITFWAKIKFKYIPDSESMIAFRVTLQDTTHRRLSNARVQSIKDEYLAIFNNPFVGSFKFRIEDYRVTMWNKKAGEMTGLSDSREVYFSDIFTSHEQFTIFILNLNHECRVDGMKFQMKNTSAGESRWVMISARLFSSRGFVEGIMLDVTDQHLQMMELERVNAELDNFTYHASHDLRAPLTSILGLVNLGMNEPDLTTLRSYLGMIRDRVVHMDLLLKDLISISYNNKVEGTSEFFDFDTEVKTIIEEYSLQDNPCRWIVDVRQQHVFCTDGRRMRTILRNLISNAFKYYNPKLKSPTIRLKIRTTGSHVAIHLHDNGIGIEFEYKSRIFDMFFRATTRSSGTGLGLYIVRSMVEKLKGKITFETTLDHGTTFLLTIPMKK
jgi:PAS domain S-box-containing protein